MRTWPRINADGRDINYFLLFRRLLEYLSLLFKIISGTHVYTKYIVPLYVHVYLLSRSIEICIDQTVHVCQPNCQWLGDIYAGFQLYL